MVSIRWRLSELDDDVYRGAVMAAFDGVEIAGELGFLAA
jgi:hypothetical protein